MMLCVASRIEIDGFEIQKINLTTRIFILLMRKRANNYGKVDIVLKIRSIAFYTATIEYKGISKKREIK